MKLKRLLVYTALLAASLFAGWKMEGQVLSPYTNNNLGSITMTSATTSAALSFGARSNSYGACAVEVTGVALSTATIGVLGSVVASPASSDYFALGSLATAAAPTTAATTQTVTAATLLYFNCAGLSSVKFITSGTFTATSIKLQLIGSPNAQVSRAGGGSGGAVTFDQIGSGTNLGHGLVCGAGCVLSPSGGGFVNANEINGVALSGLATCLLFNTTTTGVPSCAVAGTDYAGLASANTFSAKNTFNGTLFVAGSGTTGVGSEVLDVTDTENSVTAFPASVLLPNMVNGNQAIFTFGKTNSAGQAVGISYHLVGAGVAGNYAIYGMYTGVHNLYTFDSGNVCIECNATDPGVALGVTGSETVTGTQTAAAYASASNCNSSASPAVCGSAVAGSVRIPTGTTSSTLVVDTSAVTANSQIFFEPDDSLGTRLGITCNNTLAVVTAGHSISARVPGTSFSILMNGTIATNGVCGSFHIIN